MTPEQLFADILARDPTRPFVTYYDDTHYDDGIGERSELSAKSLANWVAKTHHLLADELGLGPGGTAFVELPMHWISVAAMLGCLSAGLRIASAPDGADVAFVSDRSLDRAAGVPDVYAVATESAAAGFADQVPGAAQDYVAAVRPQADAWASIHFPAGEDAACLDDRTRGEVATEAVRRAGELGLGDGARLMTERDWRGPRDWMDTLFAPLAVRGSVVYVRGASAETLARRAAQERVTNRY